MEARLVTMNDQYAFDRDAPPIAIDQFEDVIGRQFKQPKEGLGYDGSPVAHMWRTIWLPVLQPPNSRIRLPERGPTRQRRCFRERPAARLYHSRAWTR